MVDFVPMDTIALKVSAYYYPEGECWVHSIALDVSVW
jgi:hypothetical protein